MKLEEGTGVAGVGVGEDEVIEESSDAVKEKKKNENARSERKVREERRERWMLLG